MKRPRCVYSLDWVQLYCSALGSHLQDDDTILTSPCTDQYGNHREYVLKDGTEYIKGYAFNRTVWYGKYSLAIIAWKPKNHNNDPLGCAIKLLNPVLYVADWHFILADILATLGWSARSITRVDLACDLNYFINGLCPETFIRKYMLKSGSSYIREGSNKWNAHGLKELHQNNFEAIRWGSRKSGVSVYLYNKSKELKDKKYKPWIVDSWKQASLNIDKVWRVEISVNSSGRGLKDLESVFIRPLFVDELSTQEDVENAFKLYAKKYFVFRKIERGGAKRKKDMPIVPLLNLDDAPLLKPTTLYQATRSTRREKTVITELETFKEQLWMEDSFNELPLINALELVSSVYAQRSFLSRKCEQEGKHLKDEIVMNVDEHLSSQGLKQRYSQTKNLLSDSEKIKSIATIIAKKAQTYYQEKGSW